MGTRIRRFSNLPITAFIEVIEEWGDGLYLVGLDDHVGFIENDPHGVRFIHSSYVDPFCVVSEKADQSRILSASRYRVLGKLTADEELAIKWMTGAPFRGLEGR